MQIVIDIPEVFYEALKNTEKIVSGQRSGKTLMSVIYSAVANGTPLPKGHGRLIDADEILNHAHIEEDEDGDIFVKKWYCIEKDVFDNALVLIDGEAEE
jgi:hypothetical protein